MQGFFIFMVVLFGGMAVVAVVLILILTTLYKAIQFTLTATNLYKKIIIRENLMIKLLVDIRDNTKSIKVEDIKKLGEENDYIQESTINYVDEKQPNSEGTKKYAYLSDNEWVCVCGTSNPLNKKLKIQNCTNCGKNRDYVLKNSPVLRKDK